MLGDWNSGKIKYCTHPPEEERQTSSEIVTQFASEFSLNELEKGEKMDLQNLPLVRPSEMVNVEAGQINDKAADELAAKEIDEYFKKYIKHACFINFLGGAAQGFINPPGVDFRVLLIPLPG